MITLTAPSEKELEILLEWSAITQPSYGYLSGNGDTKATDEGTVAKRLDITNQAAIARLSSLVRKGWLEAKGRRGWVHWQLTEDGAAAMEYFTDKDEG